MEEENIKINYISGTSSGSIVASLYAMGYRPEEIYNLFKKYSKKIKYVDFKNILKFIYGIFVKRKIIINETKLQEWFDQNYGTYGKY